MRRLVACLFREKICAGGNLVWNTFPYFASDFPGTGYNLADDKKERCCLGCEKSVFHPFSLPRSPNRERRKKSTKITTKGLANAFICFSRQRVDLMCRVAISPPVAIVLVD